MSYGKVWNEGQPSKMDGDLLDKWVTALRSEDYGQCTGNLSDLNGSYCCLGVLAEINGMDMGKNVEGLMDVLGAPLAAAAAAAGTEASSAPAVVQANLPEITATSLAELNDGGYSFAQIADMLEAEREALLKGEELHDHDLRYDHDEEYREDYDAWV